MQEGAEPVAVMASVCVATLEADPCLRRVVLRADSLAGGLKKRKVAADSVFPLPHAAISSLPRHGRGRGRALRRRAEVAIVNCCISQFNCMVMGREEVAVSFMAPSAAQSRIVTQCVDTVRSFLRGPQRACGDCGIHSYLRSVRGDYAPRPHTLALGMRAGVPAAAARVNTAEVVRRVCETTARQIENPQTLLLPVADRPKVLPRPFVRTDATYPGWVARNVRAGLQKLKPRKSIYKHRRKPVVSGVFAAEKDEMEDRCIMALCPQNSLIDKRKLWKPRFASMPHVRDIFVEKGRRFRVHKIDGRHFFHMLRVGRRWSKFYASLPLPCVPGVAEKFPTHCSVPMGFTASASWA